MKQDLRIIIEGPDGAGKSTLKDFLIYQFHNLKIIRNERGSDQDLMVWWPEQLDVEKSPVVPLHDRFFYSELVYGPVIRGHLSVPDNMVVNIQWFLRSVALLIYCRPPFDVIKQEIHRQEQMKGVHDKLLELTDRYDSVMGYEMQWYGDRFIHYDWTKEGDLHKVEAAVEHYLGERGAYPTSHDE